MLMRTNIELDDKLVKEAMVISGVSTKKGIIDLALHEYVKAANRKKILKYKGSKIWEGDLNKMRTD
ncbi:MAG: type II toxin-antitoxin system VapB family antitoxin [Spirochaetes bacterium]|nr:type II toxin-antitoxin system VapB family antitoxin [Spirochaetota bacterium]